LFSRRGAEARRGIETIHTSSDLGIHLFFAESRDVLVRERHRDLALHIQPAMYPITFSAPPRLRASHLLLLFEK
jgi:hypothetical protein